MNVTKTTNVFAQPNKQRRCLAWQRFRSLRDSDDENRIASHRRRELDDESRSSGYVDGVGLLEEREETFVAGGHAWQ